VRVHHQLGVHSQGHEVEKDSTFAQPLPALAFLPEQGEKAVDVVINNNCRCGGVEISLEIQMQDTRMRYQLAMVVVKMRSSLKKDFLKGCWAFGFCQFIGRSVALIAMDEWLLQLAMIHGEQFLFAGGFLFGKRQH
jgi:hypothetical protein